MAKSARSYMMAAALLIGSETSFVTPVVRRLKAQSQPSRVYVPPRTIWAKPPGASDDEWQIVVDAEKASREKKYGPLAGMIVAKPDIEANQLRIWEQLEEKRNAARAASTREERRKAKYVFMRTIDLSSYVTVLGHIAY